MITLNIFNLFVWMLVLFIWVGNLQRGARYGHFVTSLIVVVLATINVFMYAVQLLQAISGVSVRV